MPSAAIALKEPFKHATDNNRMKRFWKFIKAVIIYYISMNSKKII